MFLAQNITVEILIKTFISLMHKLAIRKRRPNYNDDLKVFFFLRRFKFDFFVITFSHLNGQVACIEDVYSRNTGVFTSSSCYSIQFSPSDIDFFRNCGILLVFIYLFLFITCIFSVHIF